MPEYYFILEELPETPEIAPGFEYGLIDKDNPAPNGSKIISDEKELEELIEKVRSFNPADPEDDGIRNPGLGNVNRR